MKASYGYRGVFLAAPLTWVSFGSIVRRALFKLIPNMSGRPVILLVEDQPDDVILTGFALQSAGISNPVICVHDGREAVDYLSGNGEFANRTSYPMPALMLLDLKMPRLDGFGVLSRLKERPEYDDVTVVVLSSSNLDCDVSRAEALGADDYLVKPTSYVDLAASLKKVCSACLHETING